jgi:hypothetical protein
MAVAVSSSVILIELMLFSVEEALSLYFVAVKTACCSSPYNHEHGSSASCPDRMRLLHFDLFPRH